MSTEQVTPKDLTPSILSFAIDLPNLCSLAGLACTVLSIFFSVAEVYDAAIIGMVWAVAFDWADGLVARSIQGRSDKARAFGGQLDVLIDIVSYGAAPAILLLSVGQFSPLFLPGAFLLLAAAALRLSYFSTFGLADGKFYTGLALDNNTLVLALVFLLEGLLSQELFAIVLYASGIGLAVLNVSTIRTPKLSGKKRNVYLLTLYTLTITCVFGWRLL